MTALPQIQEAWAALQERNKLYRGELAVFESDVRTPVGALLFAMDSDGHRHLLIPVSADTPMLEDTESSGVQVRSRQLEDGGRLDSFVDVVCRKPHLSELFSILLSEMVNAIEQDPASPSAICVRVLARWRELLSREFTGLLGDEALCGLFGELWHLRELVRREPTSLRLWEGPQGGRHDFVRGASALEIKTTTSRIDRPRIFEIHGLDQLTPLPKGTLHLGAMRLERSASAGESVPDLLEDIVRLGADGLELMRRAALVGYDPQDKEHYVTSRFTVREDRIYEVGVGFPRLSVDAFADHALPSGVVNLRYQIDLSSEPPRPLTPNLVQALYETLAGTRT